MLTAFQHFLFVCLSILFSPPDLVRAFSAEGSRPSHRAAACSPAPAPSHPPPWGKACLSCRAISKGLLREAALPACPTGSADSGPHQALGTCEGSASSRSSRNRHRINRLFLFAPHRAGCLPGSSPGLAKQTKAQNPPDLSSAQREYRPGLDTPPPMGRGGGAPTEGLPSDPLHPCGLRTGAEPPHPSEMPLRPNRFISPWGPRASMVPTSF